MKSIKLMLALVVILVGVVASGSAMAYHGRHGGHVRFGVFVGAPAFWYYPSPYYYAPRYYYDPGVTVPYSPPEYIERGDAQTAPEQAVPEQARAYWYYCADAKAYYPYVKQCPGGWQRVAPQPAPGS
jgi:hypothetical protein